MYLKTAGILVVLILTGAETGAAQDPARKIDLARLGPKVGESVPDFKLQDGHGQWWTRESVMGPQGVMLVFSRSADWCPYCKTQLVELQSRLGELNAKGLGLAVVTYDSPAVLADFGSRRGITFPLLSDPGSQTIKAFGILNTAVDQKSTNFGIPFPGTFIVNRAGIVTARFFEDAYQERTTVSNVFLKLGGKGTEAAAQRIATDHLEAVTYATDETVAPGSLFSLVVDITPRRGMHLYAPGAASYRTVALKLTSDPLLLPGRSSIHLPRSMSSSRSTNGFPFTSGRFGSCRSWRSARRRERGPRWQQATRSRFVACSSTRPATTRSATSRIRCR